MTSGRFSLDHDECPHCHKSVYNGEHEIADGQWVCLEVLIIDDLEPELRDRLVARFGLE